MGEFMFGSFSGELTDEAFAAINEIARRHDFCLVPYTEPRGEKRGWFAGPNVGSPFDQAAAAAIWSDLEAAGLANARSREINPECFVGDEDES